MQRLTKEFGKLAFSSQGNVQMSRFDGLMTRFEKLVDLFLLPLIQIQIICI